MTRPAAAAIVGIALLTGCTPAGGTSSAEPPSNPPAGTSTRQARFEPDPGRVPADVRQYHAENGTRPGEVYAECAGDHVTNYWPDTAAAWGQAVSLCHSGSDHANRLEDELRRRGFDGVTVGGNTQLQSANNGA